MLDDSFVSCYPNLADLVAELPPDEERPACGEMLEECECMEATP